MNIPTGDVFEAHGLYDIDVDLAVQRQLGQSAAGWATYRPTPSYPLLEGLEEDYTDRTVKFYWCSTDHREAARAFRRCCQIWAVDSLARRDDETCEQLSQKRVLAWWEDGGLWFLTDERKEEVVSLSQWWADRLAEQQPKEVNGGVDADKEVLNKNSGGEIYADLCDAFVSLAQCNQVCKSRIVVEPLR